MNKRTIYYTSAAAVPLLALGLVAPALAHGTGARAELTEEQKTALEQVRDLHKQGKRDAAHALLESVGLPSRPFAIKFRVHPGDEKIRVHRQAMQEAIGNGDFAAFQELTKDAPFAGRIDEATFAELAEAYQLREAGDTEGANVILDRAGVKRLHPNHKTGARFFKGFRSVR